MKSDSNHEPEKKPAEDVDSAGCAPTTGSETPAPTMPTMPTMPTPDEIAVAGYLQNRQTLCKHLATISSTYDREKDRRKSIVAEIEKIDRCVARILDAQNAEVSHGGRERQPDADSTHESP